MLNRKALIYLLLSLLSLQPLMLHAQQGDDAAPAASDEQILLELKGRIQEYIDEVGRLSTAVYMASGDSIGELERAYKTLNAKWNTYYQAQQVDIATDDSLLSMVAEYQVAEQGVAEAIAKLKAHSNGLADFKAAEQFIMKQRPVYKKTYNEAKSLAMLPTTAPQLAKLKGKEQLLFAEIQKRYEQAKAIAADDPDLQQRMEKMEDRFVEIKEVSAQIQAAAYQPFFQRIKDYLMGFAAVAIILMFFHLAISKLQAVKKAREAAKKMQELYPQNNEYPTI